MNNMKKIVLIILMFLSAGIAAAGPPGATYDQENDTPLMAAPVRFFQRFLSNADGDRCPMTPSCSSYAIEAMRRHGAVKGWIMACDRLMRCGHDELKLSPPVRTRQGVRCLDPVDNNDFWQR
jgi:putative component of membrane protein insertase Oxa1/YidC/SpoIIIJ protein YidD